MFRVPNPFPVWATLFTIVGLAILISLGMWQINRLAWKEQLLTNIDREYKKPFTTITTEALSVITTKNDLIRGTLTGTAILDKVIQLQGRPFPGAEGYDIATGTPGAYVLIPVALQDGSIVLLNAGWAKDKTKLKPIQSSITADGIARLPGETPFMPDNQPGTGTWYKFDLDQMRNALDMKNLQPVIFESETRLSPDIIPVSRKPVLNNNHKQYAFFWFSMSVALAVVYGLRFWWVQK